MKKFYLFSICIFFCSTLIFSQAVGIGDVVFTPNYLLHVHRNAASGVVAQFTNTSTGNASTDGFQINLNGSNVEFINREDAGIHFFTNNTDRGRFTNTGIFRIENLSGVNTRLAVANNLGDLGTISAGTTGQILIQTASAPAWANANSIVQIVNDLQGAVNTAYTNNTTTYSNSLISNSFTLTTPGYYEFSVFVGSPIATIAAGMNFRLQNITSATTIDGPYFIQFPAPVNPTNDYGASANVLLYYNKTTTTSETIQVQWAATAAGGTTGVQGLTGSRTARIVVKRYPN